MRSPAGGGHPDNESSEPRGRHGRRGPRPSPETPWNLASAPQYYGLESGGRTPKTLSQIGRLLGVTKERVRQIQNKAMAKIKLVMEEGILRTRIKQAEESAAAQVSESGK